MYTRVTTTSNCTTLYTSQFTDHIQFSQNCLVKMLNVKWKCAFQLLYIVNIALSSPNHRHRDQLHSTATECLIIFLTHTNRIYFHIQTDPLHEPLYSRPLWLYTYTWLFQVKDETNLGMKIEKRKKLPT